MWTWLACCALRQAARTSKAHLSSEPDWFPVSVASTVHVAMERFGKWMPTRFENAFDRLVMEVDASATTIRPATTCPWKCWASARRDMREPPLAVRPAGQPPSAISTTEHSRSRWRLLLSRESDSEVSERRNCCSSSGAIVGEVAAGATAQSREQFAR
jgi:hypothetical protein